MSRYAVNRAAASIVEPAAVTGHIDRPVTP
jgi:hypothetical protein